MDLIFDTRNKQIGQLKILAMHQIEHQVDSVRQHIPGRNK
jgi:hypothetical protein